MHEFVLSGRGAQASVYERDEAPQKRTAPDDTVERGMMGVVVRMERGRDRNDSYGERKTSLLPYPGARESERSQEREKTVKCTGRGEAVRVKHGTEARPQHVLCS